MTCSWRGLNFSAASKRHILIKRNHRGWASLLYVFALEPQPCLSINKRSTTYFISHKALHSLFTSSGKLLDLRKSWTEQHSSTYLHAHTHAAPPQAYILPLKKKSDLCVFRKGHVGETLHAFSLVSFSQSERYSGGRGQRRPAGQFTALLWEFHMIQVWEWRVGKAWAVNSPWQFYLDCQIKWYLLL